MWSPSSEVGIDEESTITDMISDIGVVQEYLNPITDTDEYF